MNETSLNVSGNNNSITAGCSLIKENQTETGVNLLLEKLRNDLNWTLFKNNQNNDEKMKEKKINVDFTENQHKGREHIENEGKVPDTQNITNYKNMQIVQRLEGNIINQDGSKVDSLKAEVKHLKQLLKEQDEHHDEMIDSKNKEIETLRDMIKMLKKASN